MSGGAGGRTPGGARGDLPGRLAEHVAAEGLLEPGETVVVAVSGGLDSVVLLHLLRFHPPVPGLVLHVAHLDHAMRPGSAGDAAWVRGLARGWGLPLHLRRAAPAPEDEAAAREVRYAFLATVREAVGARSVATAHHADDQAETVLFRAVRGTGVRGLAAIAPRGPDGRVRPLLPFLREELEEWARTAGLGWRTDPTNLELTRPRAVLRHAVLPRLEAEVAPGARRALARLARLAREEREAWDHVLPELLDRVVQAEEGDRLVVARKALLAYHPSVRSRVIRGLARRFGTVLDEAGTRAADEFTRSAASGRRLNLPGGLILRRDFGRLVLARPDARDAAAPAEAPADAPLEIPGPQPGRGTATLGGRRYDVRWGTERPVRPEAESRARPWIGSLYLPHLTFPLRLRARRPGDRMRLDYGSKSLKKLFIERRIPRAERAARPVLEDGSGAVLWVAGLPETPPGARGGSGPVFHLAVERVGGSPGS